MTVHRFEVVLGISFSFNWHDALFSVHCNLAKLFHNESRFDDTHSHRTRQVNTSTYNLGYVMELQARVWHDVEAHRVCWRTPARDI